MRRPALFTKTEAKRAMQAADERGWESVTVTLKDGTEIRYDKKSPEKPVENKQHWTL